jgi:hypothetical protein
MTDEFASRALAAAKKSLPVPRQLKPRVSPPRGFPNVFNMGQGARPMTLQEGEILGYDYNRMVVQFTMLDQSEVIQCAITTAAMDDLEKISCIS